MKAIGENLFSPDSVILKLGAKRQDQVQKIVSGKLKDQMTGYCEPDPGSSIPTDLQLFCDTRQTEPEGVFRAANYALEDFQLSDPERSRFSTIEARYNLLVHAIPVPAFRNADSMEDFVVGHYLGSGVSYLEANHGSLDTELVNPMAPSLSAVGLDLTPGVGLSGGTQINPQYFELVDYGILRRDTGINNKNALDNFLGGSNSGKIPLGGLLYNFGFLITFDRSDLVYLRDILGEGEQCDSDEGTHSANIYGHQFRFCINVVEHVLDGVEGVVNVTLPILIYGDNTVDHKAYDMKFKVFGADVHSEFYSDDSALVKGNAVHDKFVETLETEVKSSVAAKAISSAQLQELFNAFLQPSIGATSFPAKFVGTMEMGTTANRDYGTVIPYGDTVVDGNVGLKLMRTAGWGLTARQP